MEGAAGLFRDFTVTVVASAFNYLSIAELGLDIADGPVVSTIGIS